MDRTTPLSHDDSLTLVVVRLAGRKYKAKRIPTGDEVTAQLRLIVSAALNIPNNGRCKPYDPDDEQGDADYLQVAWDEVFDTHLVDAIRPGASLEPLSRDDKWYDKLFCYAVVVEDNDDQKTILVRKASPVQLASRRLVTRLFGDHLDQIEEPIFAFDDFFDVIIRNDVVLALNQERFERLFKSTPVVLGKVDTWVATAFEQLPVAASALEAFKGRAEQNSYTLRKLRSIVRKPHVRSLTIEQFTRVAVEARLDLDRLIQDGQINLCSETEKDVLALLNEDYFDGPLSRDSYLVNRKSTRKVPSSDGVDG